MFKKVTAFVFLALGLLLGMAAPASAAAVDVTALTADIAAQMTSITAVGGAVLLVYLGIKAFNWIRAAVK